MHVISLEMMHTARAYSKTLGMGPGMWWSSNGEHKNWMVKLFKAEGTSMGDARFEIIIRSEFIRFSEYPESLVPAKRRNLQFSVCETMGHMMTNRNCSMHPKTCIIDFSQYFSLNMFKRFTRDELENLSYLGSVVPAVIEEDEDYE